MRHITIPSYVKNILKELSLTERSELIKKHYKSLRKNGACDVSIVIPAYNEEENVLKTLHSLALNKTEKSVEIIVVNNNSSDSTEALVKLTGVQCILEEKRGITAARNAGLQAAKGTYILNADADAIYPENWIDAMVTPLEKHTNIALTYGNFSFIPTGNTSRLVYFFYEYAAGLLRYYKKNFREEAVNVYGFNSCYKRLQGIEVEGYNHPPGSNEDGWLALKLRDKGFGKLHYVTAKNALVWTSDRRIQLEGGFFKGVQKRIQKILFPQKFTEIRADL